MRIAIVSDMHGNCVALDAVLADLQRAPADRVVCLGDAIQGGPQPAETVARLRDLGCPVVMGNADAWLLKGDAAGVAEATTPVQHAVREWSLAHLSAADQEFIAGFQPTVSVPLEGGHALLAFHGSPHSFDDIILPETPEEDFQRMLGAYEGDVLCGGHTHLQQVRRCGPGFFFNPGSVGLAYDRQQPEESFALDPWAEYAVLTSEGNRLSLEFRRVPYAVEELLRIYTASGRPHADTLIAQYRRGLGAYA